MSPEREGEIEALPGKASATLSSNASAALGQPPVSAGPPKLAARPTDRSYRLPILVSLGAFLLVLVFFLEARRQTQLSSAWYYWIGLALTVIPGILSRNRLAATFSVGLFAFLQSFSYVLSAPYGIVYSTDPIYNFQAVSVLAGNHFWIPGSGAVQAVLYSFYPGSTFLQTAFAMTTGLPYSVAFMFATALLRFAVLPLAIFKLLRRFVSDKPSLIAVALLFATPSYLLDMPVLQEFAIVFLVLSLYAIYMAPWSSRAFALSPSALTAAVFFLGTVAVSHYFTAYIFAFFLAALAAASLVEPLRRLAGRSSGRPRPSTRALTGFRYAAPVFAYVFLLWSLYVSSTVDVSWFTYGENQIKDALSPASPVVLGGATSGPGGVRAGYTYSTVELALIVGALALWVLLALVGALLLGRHTSRARSGQRTAARAVLSLFVASLILLFVTVPLVITHGFFVPLRVFEFAGLGLAPLAGFFITYLLVKKSPAVKLAAAGMIGVLVVGGSLLPLSTPRFYYIAPSTQYCEMATHETPDVVAAALWAKDHLPHTASLFGDELAYDIFGGYGQFTTRPVNLSVFHLFSSTTINASLLRGAGVHSGAIFVIDRYMTQSICFASFVSHPLSQQSVDKFGTYPSMSRLFQNAATTIYRWDGP